MSEIGHKAGESRRSDKVGYEFQVDILCLSCHQICVNRIVAIVTNYKKRREEKSTTKLECSALKLRNLTEVYRCECLCGSRNWSRTGSQTRD